MVQSARQKRMCAINSVARGVCLRCPTAVENRAVFVTNVKRPASLRAKGLMTEMHRLKGSHPPSERRLRHENRSQKNQNQGNPLENRYRIPLGMDSHLVILAI